jgi:cytochrome c peroxidase
LKWGAQKIGMKKKTYSTVIYLLVTAVVGGGLLLNFTSQENEQDDLTEQSAPQMQRSEPISPLPPPAFNARKATLGQKLFHEKRLSHDNSVACSHCHDLKRGGVDRLPRSFGINNAVGSINTPTVYNSGLNFVQFWDGRAPTLEDQVNGPIAHPAEMGSNWEEIVGKLKQDKGYAGDFASVYSDGITPANIRNAIAEFERSLLPPSRFDRWLSGNKTALSEQETAGYRLFVQYGCVACHQGRNVGGNMFQKFGVVGDYFKDRGNPTEADMGRYNVTHQESDRHVFKVPSLRNVALTPPYFHDGSAETLDQAIHVMGRYQLGIAIPDADRHLIEQFLQTLTGENLTP